MIRKEEIMKKLLVLLLVLGVTGASYGALTDFELQLAGTTLTVVGLNAVSLNYGVYDMGGQAGSFSTPTAILPDGSDGNAGGKLAGVTIVGGGYDGFQFMTLDSSPSTDPIDAMNWFTVTYTGSVGDIVTVYDIDNASATLGTMEILVPEPISIALLGLGGLFLRRRK